MSRLSGIQHFAIELIYCSRFSLLVFGLSLFKINLGGNSKNLVNGVVGGSWPSSFKSVWLNKYHGRFMLKTLQIGRGFPFKLKTCKADIHAGSNAKNTYCFHQSVQELAKSAI